MHGNPVGLPAVLKMVVENKKGHGQAKQIHQLMMELLVIRMMVLANFLAAMHVLVRNVLKNYRHVPFLINIQKQ